VHQPDIYLIRHGESRANVEGRFSSLPPGPGLTARGRRQALSAAAWLGALAAPPARIIASPLLRARQTARPLARALALPIEISPELRETELGAWDGQLIRDLAASPAMAAWRTDPDACPPPGGETFQRMADRILGLIRREASAHVRGPLAVFSHLDPIVAACLHLAGLPASERDAFFVPCGGIVRIGWDQRDLRFLGVVHSPPEDL